MGQKIYKPRVIMARVLTVFRCAHCSCYIGIEIYCSIFDSTICLARTDRHPNVIRTKVSVTFVIFRVFVMMIMPPTIAIFSIIIALFEAFPVRFLTYNISFYFCLFNNDTIFVMANKTYIHRFLSKKKTF